MSGTDIRTCYAMSGTDLALGPVQEEEEEEEGERARRRPRVLQEYPPPTEWLPQVGDVPALVPPRRAPGASELGTEYKSRSGAVGDSLENVVRCLPLASYAQPGTDLGVCYHQRVRDPKAAA
eukprot:738919-Rhodomonas_salina.2